RKQEPFYKNEQLKQGFMSQMFQGLVSDDVNDASTNECFVSAECFGIKKYYTSVISSSVADGRRSHP
ncbi:hypothetical protein OS493_028420, partial [Desmophyllum pertusum]